MGRPEHVRCENCCYWRKMDEIREGYPGAGDAVGECRRFPPPEEWPEDAVSFEDGKWIWTQNTSWCGEFRAEWPGESRSKAEEDWMKAVKEGRIKVTPST